MYSILILVFLIILVIHKVIYGIYGTITIPPPLPEPIKDRIVEYIAINIPEKEIIRIKGINKSFINRIKNNLLI